MKRTLDNRKLSPREKETWGSALALCLEVLTLFWCRERRPNQSIVLLLRWGSKVQLLVEWQLPKAQYWGRYNCTEKVLELYMKFPLNLCWVIYKYRRLCRRNSGLGICQIILFPFLMKREPMETQILWKEGCQKLYVWIL